MKTRVPFILAACASLAAGALLLHDLESQRRALRLSLAAAAIGGTGYTNSAEAVRARRDEFLRASGWDESRIAADRTAEAVEQLARVMARR